MTEADDVIEGHDRADDLSSVLSSGLLLELSSRSLETLKWFEFKVCSVAN